MFTHINTAGKMQGVTLSNLTAVANNKTDAADLYSSKHIRVGWSQIWEKRGDVKPNMLYH